MRFAIPAVVVVLLAGIAGFTLRPHKPSPPPAQQALAPARKDMQVEGTVHTQHTIPVPSPSNGVIEALLVEEGQDVFEGQVLARVGTAALDTEREAAVNDLAAARERVTTLESQLIASRLEASRARTDASRAQDEHDRADKLYKRQTFLQSQGATPRLAFEKAQRDFETAQREWRSLDEIARQSESRASELIAAIQNAKQIAADKQRQAEQSDTALQAAEIHAPAAGIVVSRKGEVGKAVSPEERDALFRIAVDLQFLEAAFAPPRGLQSGQQVTLAFPEMQIAGLPAQVATVTSTEAVAQFASPSANIRPGMKCTVTVPIQ